MTTELFIDKDVCKTDETLHQECILKCRKQISDVSCCILFYSCDSTESENVNFINISDEKLFFVNFENKTVFLINRSLQVECQLK